ncbi:MAG: GeoRSP system SPASM domain protein [Geobacter sp.]|nr:GeoRSP system SPASM domain protein [Geobacter sp.]
MELATPITIYWDIPKYTKDSESIKQICADISACHPLMLQLHCRHDSVQPNGNVSIILEQLQKSGIAVFLSVPAKTVENASLSFLPNIAVKELLLSTEHLNELTPAFSTVKSIPGTAVGVSFSVTRNNWKQLPELVELCRSSGVQRLVLPMQRLYNNETPFFISVDEQQELTNSLSKKGGIKDLNLTIHDPFLWRAFNPGIPFPQAGCQAANTMIAIAPDGGVYPCPTLPVRLGTIGENSLREIILSSAKKDLRRKLLSPPEDCLDCTDVSICRGGCRGRVLVLEGSLDGIDAACK